MLKYLVIQQFAVRGVHNSSFTAQRLRPCLAEDVLWAQDGDPGSPLGSETQTHSRELRQLGRHGLLPGLGAGRTALLPHCRWPLGPPAHHTRDTGGVGGVISSGLLLPRGRNHGVPLLSAGTIILSLSPLRFSPRESLWSGLCEGHLASWSPTDAPSAHLPVCPVPK